MRHKPNFRDKDFDNSIYAGYLEQPVEPPNESVTSGSLSDAEYELSIKQQLNNDDNNNPIVNAFRKALR